MQKPFPIHKTPIQLKYSGNPRNRTAVPLLDPFYRARGEVVVGTVLCRCGRPAWGVCRAFVGGRYH